MIVSTEGIGEKRMTPLGYLTIKDVDIIKWSSGKFYVRYLYDDLMDALVEDMHKNVANGYDNMIITEGAEGSGKSTHVYGVCSKYSDKFDIESNYMYGFDDVMEALDRGDDQGSIFWLDESVNIANKRRWQSRDNINFTDLLIMMRSRGWTVDMCIPRASDLDFYIREHRFRYLVTVEPMTFPNEGRKDRGYWKLDRRNPTTRQLEHVGYGIYEDMPAEAKRQYEAIKKAAQEKKFSEIVDSGKSGYHKKYEESCLKINDAILSLHNSGIPRSQIMQAFKINSDNTYYGILKKARDRGN